MNAQEKRRLLKAIRENSRESNRLEFKLRIDLTTPNGKAEFVRDILSLANSEGEIPREPGYFVLGFKNGQISDVAGENYDGATFRDILHAYIAPDLQVHYEELLPETCKRVGVLEITPDHQELYVVRKDFSSADDRKLLVAGQAWGRLKDQKVRLDGEDIAGRVRLIGEHTASRAIVPLRQRLTELEDLLRRSGPTAEVRRIGYAIELESDWSRIP